MDLGLSLFILAAFLAVVLLIEGAYLLWNDYKGPEVQRLEKRLRSLSAGRHGTEFGSLLKERNLSDTPWLDRLLLSMPRVSSLDRLLEQAGVSVTVARFILISLLAGAATFLVLLVLRTPFFFAVAMAAIALCVPLLVVVNLRSRRLHKFDEQLPDALDLLSRALRAGHAFPSAMQMVATEAADPIATEFQITFEEINYGVSVGDAMLNLATRVPSIDLRYFVISVLLQRETGGNLSELLDNLATLIRERFKLLGKIRVLSAEGKLSAYILIGLPFVTAGMIFLVNPKFMSVLWTDPAGLNLVFAAIVAMIVGAFWMWRIVKIRV
ncbi:type II secretion system F family protein [Burkholderiaceae bacterium FT117]|uniref:type II secretion system F family protein n=1 Tax=Zeimonas sediminis TaxID=2944268 RepID=UPI002342FFC5|nr:type II secretion system F family protein [Zeimonas sediminis]MCM5572078.1 type II secretion system F family protein [Zeimonas sediminis]